MRLSALFLALCLTACGRKESEPTPAPIPPTPPPLVPTAGQGRLAIDYWMEAPSQDDLFDKKQFSGTISLIPVGVTPGTSTVQELAPVVLGPLNASRNRASINEFAYTTYPGVVRPKLAITFQVQDSLKPKESHRLLVQLYNFGRMGSRTAFTSATMTKDAQGYWSATWKIAL